MPRNKSDFVSLQDADQAMYGINGKSLDLKSRTAADGSLIVGPYRVTKTGLEMPANMTEKEWEDVGAWVKTLESSVSWVIGDWAYRAHTDFKKSYEEIAQKFDYKQQTLEQYASICSQVHPASRHPDVPFSHHRLITKMNANQQRQEIKRALKPGGGVYTYAEFKAILENRTLPAKVSFQDDPVEYVDQRVSKIERQILTNLDNLDDVERVELARMFRRIAANIEASDL